MIRKIIACDQASVTAICVSNESIIDELHLIISNSKYDYVDRANYIRDELHKIIKKQNKINNCGIITAFEDTQLQMQSYKTKRGDFAQKPNNPDVFKKLCKLLGILESLVIEKGYAFKTVSSSEWRKYIGIKGKKRDEKKRSAIKYVTRLGVDLDNLLKKYKFTEKELYDRKTDLADCICICIYIMKKLKIIGRNKNAEVNPKLKLKIHRQK